jgi:hypothetical protein
VPARTTPSARSRLIAALLALTVVAPAAAYGQGTSGVMARATVVSAHAPRIDVSLVAAPVVRRVSRPAVGEGVEVRTAVRIAGNAGFRLLVRARAGAAAAGLTVRDASGVFRPLSGGAAVEVARGSGHEASRDVVYRMNGAAFGGEPLLVYELVYEPVT